MARWMVAAFLAIMLAPAVADATGADSADGTGECVRLRAEWTPEQRWIWERNSRGLVADLSTLPTHGDTETFIDAGFIEDILTHECLRAALQRRGVWIANAKLSGLEIANLVIPLPISIADSTIAGDLHASNVLAERPVALVGVDVRGEIAAPGAQFGSDLVLDRVRARRIDLAGTRVDGQRLSAQSVRSAELILTGIETAGQLDLMNLHVTGGVRVENARIGRGVNMTNNSRIGSLDLGGSRVADDIDLSEVKVAGSVELSGLTVDRGLSIRGAAIGGDLNVLSARIANSLNFSGTAIAGKMNATGVNIGDGLYMTDGFRAAEVHIRRGSIGGQLALNSGSVFDRVAIVSVRVGDSAYLGGGSRYDEIEFVLNRVGRIVDLADGHFGSVNLSGTVAEQQISFYSPEHKNLEWYGSKSLKLGNVQTDTLEFDFANPAAWPATMGLRGLTYNQLKGDNLLGDGTSDERTSIVTAWLRLDKPFTPQPYEQMIGALRRAGLEEEANGVAYERWDRDRRETAVGLRKAGLGLLRLLTGYGIGWGYLWTLGWATVLVVVGWLVLHLTGEREKHKIGFIFSLDRLLPVISVYSGDDVHLTEPVAQWYFALHAILGFVIAAFLGAAMAILTK